MQFAGGNIVDVRSTVPTSGTYTAGDFILESTTAVKVTGWKRLTTGSGHVLNTDWVYVGGLTSGTAVATTSGTSHDFTGIPSWAKKITVMFSAVSTNGTSPIQVQIGAGSVSNSGYVGTAGGVTNTGNVMGVTSFTTGFGVVHAFGASDQPVSGSLVLTLLNSATGTWSASGTVSQAPGSFTGISTSGGAKTLSGVLDWVRITTVNGTDTFDAGSCNILYE